MSRIKTTSRYFLSLGLGTLALGTLALTASLSTAATGRGSHDTRRVAASITARIPLPAGAGELAAGFGSIWSVNFNSASVSRIDPATDRVLATIPTHGPAPGDIAITAGAVWVSEGGDNNSPDGHTVVRIDPVTNRVTGRIRVGALPEGIVFDDGSLWVGNHHSGALSRIDPTAGRVSGTTRVVRVPLRHEPALVLRSSPQGLAAGPGAIWAGVPVFNGVVRVNPTTGRIVAVVPVDLFSLTFAGGSLWLSDFGDLDHGHGRLVRLALPR
jgi:YVTN family beta-propeller protein